jgi:hypothetical protein
MIPNYAYLRSKKLNYRVTGQNRKLKPFRPEFNEFLKMIANNAYLRSKTLNYRDTGENRK